MKRTTDMTKGSIAKLLLTFSLPLLLSNLGQQLYVIVDAAIVGRGIGVKALAAVGASDWTYWMFVWTIMGLTQGFGTFVSRAFGEKNHAKMNKVIAMSTVLGLAAGILMTVTGMVAARPLLTALKTPPDILEGALGYFLVMTSGLVVVTAYNIAASVLRALGDAKRPLYAMLIAVGINIALDLLFVIVFKWGLTGAAAASIVSQFVSFLYCLRQIKKIPEVRLTANAWKPDIPMLGALTRFGIPIAALYIVIAAGGIILQAAINRQGSLFIAGFTATNKLYGLLECAAISLGLALATFAAQNYGAGNRFRVRRGVRVGLVISLIAALVVSVFAVFGGKWLLKAFIDSDLADGEAVLAIAERYLFIMSALLVILFPIHIYRNAVQALGNSVWPMISGVVETVVRMILGVVIVLFSLPEILYYTEPAAWLAALIFIATPYYHYRKKLLKD